MSSLNVTDCPELLVLSCAANRLTELSLVTNTKLKSLTACANKLDSIDIRNCSALNSLATESSVTRRKFELYPYDIMCDSWSGENQASLKVDVFTTLITDPTLDYAIVSFESNGGTEIQPITSLRGFPIVQGTPWPTKSGMLFNGWYTDPELTTKFRFGNSGTVVNGNITLYAGWRSDGPTITKQPENKEVTVGETVTFTCTATGNGTLSYQWQYKAPNSSSWANSNAASAKTSTYTFAAKAGHNGYQFRCVVSDGNSNSTESNAATLTILPKITSQPEDTTATAGSDITLKVSATGAGTLTYQWQYKAPNSSSWTNSNAASAKTTDYSFTVKAGHNGYQFRCVVTDSNNKQATSNAVTLTVLSGTAPKILTQPKNTNTTIGSALSLKVSASGTGTLKYQWQYKAPGTTTWKSSSAASAKTATYAFTVKAGHNGYQFRCIVTDGNNKQVQSNAVLLTVVPKITTQPKDTKTTIGSTVSLKAAATGVGTLKYQWQYKAPGTTAWKNSSAASAKTATYSFAAKAGHQGYQFRCVVTDGNNKQVESNAVTLTIVPKITTHPKDTTVTAGSKTTLTVAATGAGTLTYQWQYKSPKSTTWSNSNAATGKTTALAFTVKAAHNGYQFRCVVTDAKGNQTVSNEITITVK